MLSSSSSQKKLENKYFSHNQITNENCKTNYVK